MADKIENPTCLYCGEGIYDGKHIIADTNKQYLAWVKCPYSDRHALTGIMSGYMYDYIEMECPICHTINKSVLLPEGDEYMICECGFEYIKPLKIKHNNE